MNIFWCYTGS